MAIRLAWGSMLAVFLVACSAQVDEGPNGEDAGGDTGRPVVGDAGADALSDATDSGGDAEEVDSGCADCDPCAAADAPAGCADYGAPVDTRPTWQERANFVLLNAIRIDPSGYKAAYIDTIMAPGDTSNANVFATSTYTAQPPLYWNDTLAQASRWHSEDKADCTSGSGPHNACDGRPFGTWIADFWTGSGTGENVFDWPYAQTRVWPVVMVSGFICDGPADTNGHLLSCVADGSDDGHRANILSSAFAWAGTGYADKTGGGGFWEQDFAGARKGTPPYPFPIVGASHVFFGSDVRFLLDANVTAAAKAIEVVIEGTAHALTTHLGGSTQGVWTYSETPASTCRSYYFQLVADDGKIWRYPAKGTLQTYGEGTCTDHWKP